MTTTRRQPGRDGRSSEAVLLRKLRRAEVEVERQRAEADRARAAHQSIADVLQGEKLVRSDPRIGHAFLNVMRAATNGVDVPARNAVHELLDIIGGVNAELAKTMRDAYSRPVIEIPRNGLDVLLESLGTGKTADERERQQVARSYMNGWIVAVHAAMGEAGYMTPGLPPNDHVALRAGTLDGSAAVRQAISVAEHGDLPPKE